MPKFLRLNLQFFAEDTHPFAEDAAPTEPHPFAADPSESSFSKFTDVPNPLLADFQAPETPELQLEESQGLEVPPTNAEKQVEELDFGGRKVQVIDPIIHDLHKDYSHLTRTYQQTNQELADSIQINNQWQEWADQQQQQPMEQTMQDNETSPERVQALNDEYMERMYENKFTADQWWNSQPEVIAQYQERQRAEVEAAVNERLAPMEEQRQREQTQQMADQFIQSHSDFEDYRESMQGILRENPSIEQLPNALDVLYAMAKVQNAPEVPTFESMLADPQYQQKILENEQIQSMVFQKYQQGKLQTNQQLPNLMGNPVGSQTPMSAGQRAPRTLTEATQNWLRSTGQ